MTDLSRDIAARVQHGFQTGSPINITAAGTKPFLGRPSPTAGSLDVSRHRGIIEYDPAELILVARAGTPLREIEDVLESRRQMLGFEPPFIDQGATLGGAVAAGLAGPRRAYSGAVRDFILGASFINGKGEIITSGGKVMKNVAGFDLFRPMAGSMGTLGLLLKIALRIVPRPEAEETLLHEERDESAALEKMNRWPLQTQAISAAAWDGEHIRIRLSGSPAGIAHGRVQIGGDRSTDNDYWHDLNNFRLEFFKQRGRLWRIALAPATGPIGENSPQLIDWGGAQRWLISDEPADVLRARVARHGGHASCYSDDPDVPTFHPPQGSLLALNRRFKAALDPAGILNPGRLVPEL